MAGQMTHMSAYAKAPTQSSVLAQRESRVQNRVMLEAASKPVSPGMYNILNSSGQSSNTLASLLVKPQYGHDFTNIPVFRNLSTRKTGIKAEAAFGEPDEDKTGKSEAKDMLPGAGIGGGVGLIAGGAIGGALGGLLGAGIGALAGLALGALIGGIVGAFVQGSDITWLPESYASVAAGGSSTTVEKPFTPAYEAVEDVHNHAWRLKVRSLTGGANITVHTGGSRDPIASPPTTEAEARDAVTVMKGYYARGSRGSWHTEAASRAHEEHHYAEWQCSSDHYWPLAKAALQGITVPRPLYPTAGAALTALRSGPGGADAKLAAFQHIARDYWFTLADSAGSRPYAAGQLVLNQAIISAQNLAKSKGWTVPQGIDRPSAADPCYQPWLPYTP